MAANDTTWPQAGPRLDRLPTSRFHWSVYWMVALGLLVSWSNAIGGLVLAQLKEIGWTNNDVTAVFTSLTTAGMFLGALLGGIIGDKIGRRKGYMAFVALHILTMVVGALSPSMSFLITVRCVMGFALGGLLTILFASWTEYVPSRDRGSWSARASFIGNWSYPLASLIASFLAPLVSPGLNWRIQLIIPAALSTAVLVVVWKKFPESPRWLESTGQFAQAEELLEQIEASVEKSTGTTLVAVEDAPRSVAEAPAQIPYRALFRGQLLKRVVLGAFVLIAMNVVQYTLINWLPTMLLDQGIALEDSIVLNTMSMFGAPIGIFIAVFVIEKLPRKVFGVGLLVIIAGLGYFYSLQTSIVALSVTGFFLITFVYMYVCFASAVYVPEIWPTAAKLRGAGLANSVGRISGIAAPFAVASLLSSSGMPGVFLLLGGTALVTAVVILVLGTETRGASIEAISALDPERKDLS